MSVHDILRFLPHNNPNQVKKVVLKNNFIFSISDPYVFTEYGFEEPGICGIRIRIQPVVENGSHPAPDPDQDLL